MLSDARQDGLADEILANLGVIGEIQQGLMNFVGETGVALLRLQQQAGDDFLLNDHLVQHGDGSWILVDL